MLDPTPLMPRAMLRCATVPAAIPMGVRWRLAGAAIATSLCLPMAAVAAGLGPILEQSSLGQSLRVVVPVLLGPGEEFGGECFRLVAAERDADGIPQALFGRVALERTGAGARLVVTHTRPVQDPVLRLTIEVGCDAGVRREYTLLMDPPVIDVPAVVAESEPVAPAAAAAPAVRERGRRASAGTPAASSRTASQGRGAGAPSARKSASTKGSAASKALPRRPPPPSQATAPRLKVSRAAPGATPAIAATEGPTPQQVQAQQELADALEAETVVLRQRVAELSALVDRMQEQVRAQEAAQRAAAEAAAAAEEAARASPWTMTMRWLEANGTLVALIVALALLLAGGLLWQRRRNAGRAGAWPISGISASQFEPTSTLGEVAPSPREPANEGARKPDARRQAGTNTSALAVSELSHVTEEARVYVALGHADRAMDVLREHVRATPRSMPAAWLMLLDLYHTHGRRQEFRQLAQEFHQRANVEAPTWESYAAQEHDANGLDAYPHVAKRVVGLWRLPECREYLEQLLYENRDGQRNGFSLAAYGDILTLLQVLDAPVVDIDSDLAEEDKLRAAWSAAAKEANLAVPAGAAQSSVVAPDVQARARPTQESIVFELDADLGKPKAPPER